MEEKKLKTFAVKENESCPVRDIIARLGDKWSLLILTTLKVNGTLRFGQIKQSIGDISQRMLSVTLRSLEADGIVSRKAYNQIPPKVEYELTKLGEELFTHANPLIAWAESIKETILLNRDKYQKQN